MASILEIANNALIEVGESPVTQDEYDERLTKGAKVVSARYEACKRHVLRSYHWKDAETAVKIDADTITETAADTKYGITIGGATSYLGTTANLYLKTVGSPNIYYEAPVYGYVRNFTPPTDMLRLKMVLDINGQLEQSDYKSGIIVAHVETIYVAYTKDLDEASMDPSLSDSISLYLASKTARFLGAADEVDRLQADYFTAWRLAKSFDAQQDSSRRLNATDWLSERLLSGTTGEPYPSMQ
jgi:hypothetical protein